MFAVIAASSFRKYGSDGVIPPVNELEINILTPTEGQEITGDVNITFELLNNTRVNILTPTEGQSITGDVNITFEII